MDLKTLAEALTNEDMRESVNQDEVFENFVADYELRISEIVNKKDD